MTIIDTPPDQTTWPDPNLDGIYTLTYQGNDYLRRIHWWVRLFGIIWILVPILMIVGAMVFMVAARAFHGVDSVSPPSAYSRCIERAVVSPSDCARMYPD